MIIFLIYSVKILLQPKIFKYKKLQKKRSVILSSIKIKLSCGDSGLLILQPLYLTSNHLTRFKLFLKRSIKKSEKTKRFFWFNSFPQLPLTRKVIGSRMGKGKGKVKKWFIKIKPNTFLFEFLNLRNGRATHFMKQISYKLNIPTKFFFNNTKKFNYPFNISRKVLFNLFW